MEVDASSFTSPSKLDVTGAIAKAINASVAITLPGVQAWAGEVGPHNGGSVPCDHTTMRWANFGDSLWYMDTLGTKALNGYGAVCRQDLIGADYGLLDCSSGIPLPDYWSGLMWASVMGPRVFSARIETPNATAVRAYAHCTNERYIHRHISIICINMRGIFTDTSLLFV